MGQYDLGGNEPNEQHEPVTESHFYDFNEQVNLNTSGWCK
jgi:hypothetical protein